MDRCFCVELGVSCWSGTAGGYDGRRGGDKVVGVDAGTEIGSAVDRFGYTVGWTRGQNGNLITTALDSVDQELFLSSIIQRRSRCDSTRDKSLVGLTSVPAKKMTCD